MPLDLPPPLPPQQAEIVVLEKRHASAPKDQVIELAINKYTLLVSGNTYLAEKRIREVTSVAQTPSQAILLLNALYAADGHLFVNVQYARQQDTIFVQVNEGYLAEVDAPPRLQPYFEPFEGQRGLTETDLEPRRVLAELKATRAGFNMTGKYSIDADNPEAYTWTIDGEPIPDHDKFKFGAAFGNPGNRFLGRYFGLGNASYSAPNGDTFTLGYAHGFTNLGSSRGGENFNRGDFNYATVTRWGLYGFNAAYTDYAISNLVGSPAGGGADTLPGDEEDAEIIELGLTGNQFLYANDKTRVVLEQQLEYVDSVIDFSAPDAFRGQDIQDEQYAALRVGGTASHSWELFDRNGNLNGGLGYKRGIAGDVDTDFPTLGDPLRTEDFDIVDGKFDAAYELPWNMLLGLNLKGQLSLDDRLPQQQQWVLGGPDNLSAFLPGILVGDGGSFGNLRLQLPRGEIFENVRYRFSLFIEAGLSKFEKASGDTRGIRSASDAGVKLEVALYENLQLTVHVAEEITTNNIPREVLEDSDSDVFFNLRAQF